MTTASIACTDVMLSYSNKAVTSYIVLCSVNGNHAKASLLNAIYIIMKLAIVALKHSVEAGIYPYANKLAVLAKVIVTRSKMTTASITCTNIELSYSKKTVSSYIILRSVYCNHAKTILNRTVLQEANSFIVDTIDTSLGFISLEQLTGLFIKVIKHTGCKCTNSNYLMTSVQIAFTIEAIGLAINLLEHIVIPMIIVRAVEIPGITIVICMPHTVGQVTFVVKHIGNTGACATHELIFARLCKKISRTEEIPDIINKIPTTLQFAINSVAITVCSIIVELTSILRLACADTVFAEVVVEAFYKLNAGECNTVYIIGVIDPTCVYNAVGVSLAVGVYTIEEFATRALKNAVNNLKIMAGCGKDGAPIYNRFTYVAISSTGVSSSCTGSCNICHRGSGVIKMPSVGFVLNLGFGSKVIVEYT